MKTVVKIVLWLVLAIVALVVGLVLSLPLWLGSIARPGVNALVPTLTKGAFNIEHLSLNPYNGRFEMRGLMVGNPSGYSEPVAVSVDNVVVDVDLDTVTKPVIHIEEAEITGVFVSYQHGGAKNVDNFTQLMENVKGGRGETGGDGAKKAEPAKSAASKKQTKAGAKSGGISEKFIIDNLTIGDIRLKYEFITLPVPVKVTLKDLGKKTGGLTAEELGMAVWEAILNAAAKAGGGAKALGGLINSKGTEGVKALDELINDNVGEKGGDALKNAAQTLKGLFNSK